MLMDRLPRTASGKLAKASLRQQVEQQSGA
jgi:acyl-coenzyme A synthetase/AMP-(fatty) acid ligase